jgi:hypothetical protein
MMRLTSSDCLSPRRGRITQPRATPWEENQTRDCFAPSGQHMLPLPIIFPGRRPGLSCSGPFGAHC